MMWMFLPLTFALTFLTTHPELSALGCVGNGMHAADIAIDGQMSTAPGITIGGTDLDTTDRLQKIPADTFGDQTTRRLATARTCRSQYHGHGRDEAACADLTRAHSLKLPQ